MENRFVRVRSIKDIVICTLLLVTGLLLVTLPISDALIITGFFILFAGLLLCVMLKTGYKDVETGARFCKTERFFGNEMREFLKKSIESPTRICTDSEDKGSSLRLDIYHSKSSGKVFCQLYEYIPYKYVACSKIYEHSYDDAAILIVDKDYI